MFKSNQVKTPPARQIAGEISAATGRPTPVREAQIAQQLGELNCSLDRLEAAASGLTTRIGPILESPPEEGKADSPPEVRICDLATVIRTYKARVCGVAAFLESAHARVEL